MAIQFLPLLIQSLIGAGVSAGANALTSKDTNVQQGAAPSGGAQSNPIADFFGNFTDPSAAMNKDKAPSPIVTENLNAKPQAVQQAPVTDLEAIQGPPEPSPGAKDKNQQKQQELGDLLASIPEALAASGALLGLGGEDKVRRPVDAAGGVANNPYAQAFGPLPKPPSLGEILAALPRLR